MAEPAPTLTPASTTEGIPGLVIRAAMAAGVIGLGLGIWCRSFVDGVAGPIGVTIGELGAPWVIVAFGVGALVVGQRATSAEVEAAGVALGALAGAAAMVVASYTYYGTASSPSAAFWATVGLLVGGAAGAAGAAWRSRPGGPVEALAAGGLGLVLVAEGIGRLDLVWLDAPGHLAGMRSGWLVLAGLAVPVLLTRGRPAGFVASGVVVLLAAPIAAVAMASTYAPRLGLL